MGAFAAIAQGADAEPQLITIRYEGGGDRPLLGIVGKAVTFDSGGYSIKPSRADARDEVRHGRRRAAASRRPWRSPSSASGPARDVIGATENMVSARAARPGDIVRAKAGITIEVNNTDAEGRWCSPTA